MTNSPSVEHTQDEQHTAEVSKVITMDSKVTFEVTNSNIWLNHLATATIIQVGCQRHPPKKSDTAFYYHEKELLSGHSLRFAQG